MSIFKKAADIVSGGLVKEVAGLADRFIRTSEEKDEFLHRVKEAENKARFDLLKLDAEDRASARQMQMEALRQTDSFSKRFVPYLAFLIIMAAIGFGVALLFYEVPEENRRLFEMFCDIFLFAGAITVIQFFFGSSKGSSDKTDILGRK